MKYIFLTIALFVVSAHSKECIYPADPINWLLRFCGYQIQTDDEIAIQVSACFKSAEKDLKESNKCKMNEKYKSQLCKTFLMKDKKYVSLKDCLNDPDVKPFFAGG